MAKKLSEWLELSQSFDCAAIIYTFKDPKSFLESGGIMKKYRKFQKDETMNYMTFILGKNVKDIAMICKFNNQFDEQIELPFKLAFTTNDDDIHTFEFDWMIGKRHFDNYCHYGLNLNDNYDHNYVFYIETIKFDDNVIDAYSVKPSNAITVFSIFGHSQHVILNDQYDYETNNIDAKLYDEQTNYDKTKYFSFLHCILEKQVNDIDRIKIILSLISNTQL